MNAQDIPPGDRVPSTAETHITSDIVTERDYFIIERDTIYLDQPIDLDAVYILGDLKFDTDRDRRNYLILRRKTRKVYPYAKLAALRLTALNKRIEMIQSPRKKKKYIKGIQRYVEDKFTAELKKLTRTEGQILVKLIHRQTGITMFDLIREYRSGWRAFWYNNTARLYDISLKRTYDPRLVREDYLLEDILQRSFQEDVLEYQPSALDFDFASLSDQWANTNTITKKP